MINAGAPARKLLRQLDSPAGKVVLGISLLTILILSLLPPQNLPSAPGGDKFHHLLAFAWLALLAAGSHPHWRLWKVSVGLLAYGIFIEMAQSLTSERVPEVADVFADALGIFIGLMLIKWLHQAAQTGE